MAVKIGGGENHRMGLFDMILLKDNHIDFAGGIRPAIEGAKAYLKAKGKNIPRAPDAAKRSRAAASRSTRCANTPKQAWTSYRSAP